MSVQPDELELKIGDRVHYAACYGNRAPDRGTVLVYQQLDGPHPRHFFSVQWDGGHTGRYTRTFLIRICNNCDMTYEDHGDNGKCLYSPTNWS